MALMPQQEPRRMHALINRRVYEPPQELYRRWFQEVEDCLGMEAEFDDIQWWIASHIYAVGSVCVVLSDGAGAPCDAYGVWAKPNRIALKNGFQTSEAVVKHEMIHFITQDGATMSKLARCSKWDMKTPPEPPLPRN